MFTEDTGENGPVFQHGR